VSFCAVAYPGFLISNRASDALGEAIGYMRIPETDDNKRREIVLL